jgi:conjugal transfer/type IV secretion protein DotA/TraY
MINNLNRMTAVTKYFIVLAILFAPDLFAADFKRDTSTVFLSVLFGGVSDSYRGVLEGGASILTEGFKIFNTFIATVGAGLVVYILVCSLLFSASSGKPLGEKWHTLFLPLRVAAGAGMMIPNAFGYSFIQVITMWFILMGVQIGDTVWDASINYLSQGETAITGGNLPVVAANFDTVAYIEPAIRFAACVGSYGSTPIDPTNGERACANAHPSCTYLSPEVVCSPNADCSSSGGARAKLVPKDPVIAQKCGSLAFTNVRLEASLLTSYITQIASVVNQMAGQARGMFDYLYYAPNNSTGMYDINYSVLNPTDAANYEAKKVAFGSNAFVFSINSIVTGIVNAQSLQTLSQNRSGFSGRAGQIGWISAASTYYGIIKENASVPSGSSDATDYVGDSIQAWGGQPAQAFANELISVSAATYAANGGVSAYTASGGGPTVGASFDVNYDNPLLTVVSLGLTKLIEFIVKKILNTEGLFDYPSSVGITNLSGVRAALSVDPLIKLAERGSKINVMCEALFMVGTVILIAGAIAAAVIPGLPYVHSAIGIIVPIVGMLFFAIIGVMMIFYPIGILLNTYIPFIPLMIYLSGVVGWLLLCVEAVAAAPIVALGLMHPQGDEVMGNAEYGLKLLLSLMLRPGLMVIGLLAGIVVVRIGILFFSISMNLIMETKSIPTDSLGAVVGMMFIYIGTFTIIIHKSFSLINEVPNRIMTWIGASGTQVSGEGEYLSEAKGRAEQGGKLPGDMTKAGTEGGKSGYSIGKSFSKPPSGGGGGKGGGSSMS